jgi:hypothetical protein
VRSSRPVIVVLGMLIHAGIAFFYPLPWFGLGVAGLVAAFLPVGSRGSVAEPRPATALRRAAPRLGYALCAVLALAQLVLAAGYHRSVVHDVTGVYRHPIFFDWHFVISKPIYAFRAVRDGREVAIPSFDAQGRPEVRNRYWTLLAFRVRGTRGPQLVDRYLAGWFTKEGWAEGPVRIYAKDVALPSLELDFSANDRIAERPWRLEREVRVIPFHLLPPSPDDVRWRFPGK